MAGLKGLASSLKVLAGIATSLSTIITLGATAIVPDFLAHTQTKYFAVAGAVVGSIVGVAWGMYLKRRPAPQRIVWLVLLLIAGFIATVLLNSIAGGRIPARFPVFLPIYNAFFAEPMLGDGAIGLALGCSWAALASCVRFLPPAASPPTTPPTP